MMSRKAILTTNPGHVDPGYRGVFHITLINMGKKTYPLKNGDVIVTLLIFELDNNVSKGYMRRINDSCKEEQCPCDGKEQCDVNYSGINKAHGELDYLASDFMDFEVRTKRIVEHAIFRAGWWKETLRVMIPILVAILGGFWGYTKIDSRVRELEDFEVENQLSEIRNEINELQYYDKVTLKSKIAQIEQMQLQQSEEDSDNTNSGVDSQ